MHKNKAYIGGPFKMTGDWNSQCKKLRALFSTLTEADLFFRSGMEKELLRRMERRLNKNREETIELIKSVQPGAAK